MHPLLKTMTTEILFSGVTFNPYEYIFNDSLRLYDFWNDHLSPCFVVFDPRGLVKIVQTNSPNDQVEITVSSYSGHLHITKRPLDSTSVHFSCDAYLLQPSHLPPRKFTYSTTIQNHNVYDHVKDDYLNYIHSNYQTHPGETPIFGELPDPSPLINYLEASYGTVKMKNNLHLSKPLLYAQIPPTDEGQWIFFQTGVGLIQSPFLLINFNTHHAQLLGVHLMPENLDAKGARTPSPETRAEFISMLEVNARFKTSDSYKGLYRPRDPAEISTLSIDPRHTTSPIPFQVTITAPMTVSCNPRSQELNYLFSDLNIGYETMLQECTVSNLVYKPDTRAAGYTMDCTRTSVLDFTTTVSQKHLMISATTPDSSPVIRYKSIDQEVEAENDNGNVCKQLDSVKLVTPIDSIQQAYLVKRDILDEVITTLSNRLDSRCFETSDVSAGVILYVEYTDQHKSVYLRYLTRDRVLEDVDLFFANNKKPDQMSFKVCPGRKLFRATLMDIMYLVELVAEKQIPVKQMSQVPEKFFLNGEVLREEPVDPVAEMETRSAFLGALGQVYDEMSERSEEAGKVDWREFGKKEAERIAKEEAEAERRKEIQDQLDRVNVEKLKKIEEEKKKEEEEEMKREEAEEVARKKREEEEAAEAKAREKGSSLKVYMVVGSLVVGLLVFVYFYRVNCMSHDGKYDGDAEMTFI